MWRFPHATPDHSHRVSLLALTACNNLSNDENAVLGGVVGGTVGV
jgi:hypothetical protein